MLLLAAMTVMSCATPKADEQTSAQPEKPVVYMTREISPESLVRIYESLGRPATGRVAVKISTGGTGGA